MKSRLYCQECDKSYEVVTDDIQLVVLYEPKTLLFSGDTYTFTQGCFYKSLAQIKRLQQLKENEE